MPRLAALRGRIAALALLAMFLTLVHFMLVQPVMSAYAEADAEIARSEQLLAEYRRLSGGRIQLQNHVDELRERTASQTAYLVAASDALAAADLQELVKRLVETSGGRLLSTVTLPAREAAPFRQIAIQVRMDVDIAQAQKIFYGLDSADLLVFVENLHMRAAPVREAPVFGIVAGPARVDGGAVMERVRALRDDFVGSVLKVVEDFPPEHRLAGHARFIDDHRLQVGDDTVVTTGRVVIATGSLPVYPSSLAAAGDLLATSDDVFDWQDLPESVAVFGGGIVGLELGQALHRLGVRMRLFGKGGAIGPLSDPAVR
jgi:hypothetical protein